MTHYAGPSIDHSLLSPCGRISGRAKAAYLQRFTTEVHVWWDAKYPAVTPTEAEKNRAHADGLLAAAADLEELADRGMSARRFRKEAARLRAESAALLTTHALEVDA